MTDQPARGYTIDELTVGMSASYERVITNKDIEEFAEVSGDHNPVHLDDAYAKTTRFKGRIAHGLVAATIRSEQDRHARSVRHSCGHSRHCCRISIGKRRSRVCRRCAETRHDPTA